MKIDLNQLIDSLLPSMQMYSDQCCQAFTIVLSVLLVILGSLLTALVCSQSSEGNNISYLGPSLLVIGALGLLTSGSLLLLKLTKKQNSSKRKLKNMSSRNNQTLQNFQAFASSFPLPQPSKDSESGSRMINFQSSSREERSLKIKHFRLQHKTPHDLGASRESRPSVQQNSNRENSETPIMVIQLSWVSFCIFPNPNKSIMKQRQSMMNE